MSLLGYPPLLYDNKTATGNVDIYAAEFWGATVVNTHATDSTLVEWSDSTAAATPVIAQALVKAGECLPISNSSPVYCGSGLRVTITGGTASVCTHWRRF